MSVLNEPFAIPSRVRGVWRLLAHIRDNCMERRELEEMLSPLSVAGEVRDEEDIEDASDTSHRNRIYKVISAMIKMGIVVEDNHLIKLNTHAVPTQETEEGQFLIDEITRLFIMESNDSNHDIMLLTAWFYCQNAYAPMTWDQIAPQLDAQTNANRLGCKNKTRFEQYVYWANYLGFTWTMTIGKQSMLVADPTAHLRNLLPVIFTESDTLKYSEIMTKLAEKSPVFEGGRFRKALNDQFLIEQRQPFELSTSTALAWYRLEDEGAVKLLRKSDADMYLFPETSGKLNSYSGITWMRK